MTTCSPTTSRPPSFMDDTAPPLYSPSTESPRYSMEPGPSEQRLALTARTKRHSSSTAIFARSNSTITLALRGQEQGAPIPVYGRNAVITGHIDLKDSQATLAVSVKLEGRLTTMVSESSPNSHTFLSVTHPLWKADDASSSLKACPSMFPFEVVLPSSYQDTDKERPLPPSLSLTLPGTPELTVNSHYTLTVVVSRARNRLLWRPQKSLSISLSYRPRTRPHQPILPSPFPFFSTVKATPEEWCQSSSTMRAYASARIEPVDCHLFVPAVQIYAISDTVPFYLQLQGPPESLQEFLYPPSSPSSSSSSFSSLSSRLGRRKSDTKSKTLKTQQLAKPTVRVYLTREVTALRSGSQRVSRSYLIGEATLRSLPPDASLYSDVLRAPEEGCGTLDYEGELKCRSDVTVGGFNAGKVLLKDFIAMQLIPANPAKSRLMEHKHSHPIRMVTDSFEEAPGPELRGDTLF